MKCTYIFWWTLIIIFDIYYGKHRQGIGVPLTMETWNVITRHTTPNQPPQDILLTLISPSTMERVSKGRHLHWLAEKKKWEIYIFRTFLGQKVFFFILVAENKRRKNERKRNFIYIEINNHWKPSVWAHSNVIYDVIHHFYREKTFSCLSLPLSQSLWASSFCRLLSLSLAKDFLCRSSLMRTKPNQTKTNRTKTKPKTKPQPKASPLPHIWVMPRRN